MLCFFSFIRSILLAYRKECDCAVHTFPRVTMDLVYFWVILIACFLQLLGTGLWFEYADVESAGTCDSNAENRTDGQSLCITDGPKLAIAVCVLITVVALAHLTVLGVHQLRRYRNWPGKAVSTA